MRTKSLKSLNREGGFTLIELLAVIVILGIIVAIAIPAVGSVIDRADSDADDAEVAMVEDAARIYITSEYNELESSWNGTGLSNNQEQIKIPINKGKATSQPNLYEKGFLEDRADDKSLTGWVTVVRTPITGETGGYTYEYTIDID